jgi:hypothetical protein
LAGHYWLGLLLIILLLVTSSMFGPLAVMIHCRHYKKQQGVAGLTLTLGTHLL